MDADRAAEATSHGGRIDLLAIAPDGSLVLIELKRDRTPREIVAQALDYASWVEQLTAEKVAQIYQRFSNGGSLDAAFAQRFGTELDADELNRSHQIIIVAAELDAATERIIKYLNERDIAINVVFFQVFDHGGQQLLSRAWLIDPSETQANVATSSKTVGEREPWNGEYYVSYGDAVSRSWEDARKYGCISAGGYLVQPDAEAALARRPRLGEDSEDRVCRRRPCHRRRAPDEGVHGFDAGWPDDPEKTEYFVPVTWLDTVPREKAVNELGLFGNQNTVCQPTTPKWRHTVERLKLAFFRWAGRDAAG